MIKSCHDDRDSLDRLHPRKCSGIGLTRDQWTFLAHRCGHATDAAAARAIGVNPRSVEGWKRRNALFHAAYQLILTEPVEFARQVVAVAGAEGSRRAV